MASVDWKKLHSPEEVKRIMGHNDRDLRLKSNHANENIDKDMTKYNLQNCDYATACERYDERIAYLDSKPKSNKRKDRTTAISLIVPIPEGVPNAKIGEFANKCNRMFAKRFGLENMISCNVHVDEVHDYIDSNTKQTRTSMRHMHVIFVPEQNGKLNGKAVCCKKNMIAVNNEVHEMAMRDYGVQFMDGSKQKSDKSVERLKLESLKLELEERENVVEQREEAVSFDEINIEKRERSVEARERAVATRENEVDITYKAAYKKLSEADKKLSEAVQREQAVAQRERSVQQAENSLTIQLAALQNRADELEERENKLKERELNFKREVRKEAESLLERQKNATATLEQLENNKINNQLEMLTNKFNSNN